MGLLSRLLVVLVVCLVGIVLPAAPAQADDASISLSPNSGVPGTEVTISGSNFTPSKYVDIYYDVNGDGNWTEEEWVADARTDSDGNFQATFFVPESYKGAHKVRAVENSSSAYFAETNFTVKPGLTVSPGEGPVGTNVTVEGHGFAKNENNIQLWYYLGSDYQVMKDGITADDDGWWTWSFQIPSSAKGNHKIDAKGPTSTTVREAFFKVTPSIILDEPSGSPGESITMTGDGFYARERGIKILFAGQEVPLDPLDVRADDNGHWSAAFQVPEKSKGTYNITAQGEYTKKQDISVLSFEVEPGLVLSPAEGYVDMDLTVTGHGFAINKEVTIKYDGSEKATTTTNDQGSFSGIIFAVPEGIYGAHQVTAEGAAGNTAAIFTMESVPPADTPEIVSLLDGSRVGFIGKIRPTFEWSEVFDDSGVYYSLQIAASNNVTATGEFADPIVSVTNIVGTNYTLNATQALPYGTYYWIVQAVDRAGNAGNWTAAYSFRAALLPLWASILILVAIVAVIGTAVYFFIIRRRLYYY